MIYRPRVTIIMPVHNGEPHIRQALESMLSQTFADFECLVLDDGSTDGSATVVQETGDRRVVCLRRRREGLTRTLNAGLARARGAYVARLDADDWSASDRLAEQVAFLDRHQEIGLVGTSIVLTAEDGTTIRRYAYPTTHEELAHQLVVGINPLPHSSIMFRRDIVVAANCYNPVFANSQDFDLYLRLMERGVRLASLRQELTFLRWNADSLSQRGVEQRKFLLLACTAAEARRVFGIDPTRATGHEDFLRRFDAWYYASRQERYARAAQLRRRAVVAKGTRHYATAVRALLRALAIQPSWLWRGDSWSPAPLRALVDEWRAAVDGGPVTQCVG